MVRSVGPIGDFLERKRFARVWGVWGGKKTHPPSHVFPPYLRLVVTSFHGNP